MNGTTLDKTIRSTFLKAKSKKVKNIMFKLTLKRNSLRTVRNVSTNLFSIFWYFLKIFWNLTRSNQRYWLKLELKNCKISGNFDDLDILIDGNVPETFETLVKNEPTTESKSAGLDYTAFMVNKEKSSKYKAYTPNIHALNSDNHKLRIQYEYTQKQCVGSQVKVFPF